MSDRFAAVSGELRGMLAADGTLLAASPSWPRVLGWPLEDLVGRPLGAVIHVDDRPGLDALLASTVAEDLACEAVLRVRHAAGGHRWLRCAAAPDPDQAVAYLAAIDVTREYHDRVARELIEEQAGIGSWEVDVGTGRAVWSAMTHRLYGTDPQDVSASVAEGLTRYPPTARAVISAAYDRLVEHGEPYDLELPFQPDIGPPLRVRTCGQAVVRDGVVVRVFGTFQDVTALVERELHKQRLEDTRALLEESQRLARLGHWHSELATGLVTWSPVVFELFGVDPGQFMPTRDAFMALVHPEDRAALSAAGAESLRTGEHTIDYRIVRPDGQQRSMHELGRTVCDAQDRVVRVVGTVQDVTELRRAEQALRDSEELLQRVLAATRDGWWDLDLAAGSAYYSDRWYELYGYTRDELPDKLHLWRRLTHPDELPRLEAAFAEVLARGQTAFTLPSAGLHRDGHRVPMVVRGVVDYDDAGQPVRASGATEDVTEARQAEIAKQEFVSTVSHELRTPLTSVGGALELLASGRVGPLPAQAEQLVALARRNAGRLRLLIDDLLDIERLLADRQPFSLVEQPLHPLLDQAVEDNAPFAAQYDVRFVHERVGPEAIVEVDAQRLAQVLVNYLSNAATFAPVDTEVVVRAGPSPARDDHVRVEVVDTGPGLSPQLEGRAFDRFVRADPEGRRSRGGTGLGLAISREIVERLGGRVGVDTRPGRTCFWFDLPIVAGTVAGAVAGTVAGTVADAGADPVASAGG